MIRLIPDGRPVPRFADVVQSIPTSCGDKLGRGPVSGFGELEATIGRTVSVRFGVWMEPDYPAQAGGRITKIAWQMTGASLLGLQAVGPNGTILSPTWGPELRTGSNSSRPGDEWGSGFDFPTAGCWTITASRQDVSANVAVLVTA